MPTKYKTPDYGTIKKLFLPWTHNDNGLISGTPTDPESEEYPCIADLATDHGHDGDGDRFRAEFIARAAEIVCQIAQMNYDGEEMPDGKEFVMENDDAVSTLNQLIDQARAAIMDGE